MDETIIRELRAAVDPLGLTPSARLEEGLGVYLPLLEKWSRRVRLVGSFDKRTVTIKHFADSLTLLPFLESLGSGKVVMDIGSGAGFPGIPVSLMRPDLSIRLIEPDNRKASFLLRAVPSLGVSNVEVTPKKATGRPDDEGISRGDIVVSRALMDVERWLPLGKEYLRNDGLVVGMMGSSSPGDEELRDLGAQCDLELQEVWRGEIADAGRRAIASWRQNR